MIESGYYPPGAEFDPSAPYNEPVIPERDFDITVSQTLSKNTEVTTDKYDMYEDECGTDIDTSDTDWKEVYSVWNYTPLELINKFHDYLQEELRYGHLTQNAVHNYKHLMSECENWIEDEFEVTPD